MILKNHSCGVHWLRNWELNIGKSKVHTSQECGYGGKLQELIELNGKDAELRAKLRDTELSEQEQRLLEEMEFRLVKSVSRIVRRKSRTFCKLSCKGRKDYT